MKRTRHFLKIVLVTVACLFTNSARQSSAQSNLTEKKTNVTSSQQTNEVAPIDWGKVKEEDGERLRNPHPSDWPLPNFRAGPGQPPPNYVNFYRMEDRFPSYLLCEYAVEEDHYDQAKELGWFKEALKQIRHSGSKRFPPIKWIAVTIRNVAEHKDESTFELSFKVGAIFNANEVFDRSRELSKLVAQAETDRHPFMLDLKQPTPGEQQRWVIVERHAATNHTATSSN
jgi:hypothetical protein